jgi:hypothetical protein
MKTGYTHPEIDWYDVGFNDSRIGLYNLDSVPKTRQLEYQAGYSEGTDVKNACDKGSTPTEPKPILKESTFDLAGSIVESILRNLGPDFCTWGESYSEAYQALQTFRTDMIENVKHLLEKS